ncbi:MAG: transposase [Thermoleophilaceae bacterium]
MPRKKRVELAGGIHHICARGVNKELIFRQDEDRVAYTAMLAATTREYGWLCMGYCLMPNHVHLLLETPEPNLGAGMQWLQGQYGRSFNKQYARSGHLFQDRFHQELITDEGHLLAAVGYIAVNPVAGGLCSDPAEWRWSSHWSVAAGQPAPWLAHEHLLDRLEAIAGSRCYQRLVDARVKALIDTDS